MLDAAPTASEPVTGTASTWSPKPESGSNETTFRLYSAHGLLAEPQEQPTFHAE